MAALEQTYPREKGFWYLDVNFGAFGLWVNGYGGKLWTQDEIDNNKLDDDIVTPTSTPTGASPAGGAATATSSPGGWRRATKTSSPLGARRTATTRGICRAS